MNSMELEKMKEIELQMLVEFIKICKHHDLRYFLLGGTALGAVRHKGFIPWDDDIDVGMPREDYMKFLKAAETELPAPLFLQHAGTDPFYAANFAKIRNSETTFIEQTVQNFPINHGVYIDVFPLDGTSDHPRMRKLWFKLLRWINIPLSSIYYLPEQEGRWQRRLSHILYKLIPGDYTMLRGWREKIMCRYPYQDAEVIANYCGAWGMKEVMPRSVFGRGVVGSFDGVDVILPEDWDQYLTRLYGDYMTPPPPEKRVSHHNCTVLDPEKSYTHYIK